MKRIFLSLSFLLFAVPALANEKPETLATEVLEVPLDWSRSADHSSSESLKIAYEVLNPGRKDLPLLFVIGGGPASASIGSYEEFLKAYAGHFRIVIFDQRGIGKSLELSQKDPQASIETAMKYYTGRSIAKDVGELVRHFQTPGQPFYIMGTSYGGLVAQMYVQFEAGPKPDAMILANPMPVNISPVEFLYHRYKIQMQQNIERLSRRSELRSNIARVRARFRAAESQDRLKAEEVFDRGVFWAFSREDNQKEDNFELLTGWLDAFLNQRLTHEESVRYILENWSTEATGLLAEAIFATDNMQGWDTIDVVLQVLRRLPRLRPWMLTEAHAAKIEPINPEEARKFLSIYKLAPRYTWRPDSKRLRAEFAKIQLIYTTSETDVLTPFEAAQADFAAIDPGNGIWISGEGGHAMAFSESNAKRVIEAVQIRGAVCPRVLEN